MIVGFGTFPERRRCHLDLLRRTTRSTARRSSCSASRAPRSRSPRRSCRASEERRSARLNGVLTIAGADTTAPQSQLDSFVERWKTEGVNTVVFSGEQVSSKQFVDKVAQQIPGVLLITDTGDAKGEAQDETKAGGKNNFEGMLYASGPTSQEYDQSPNWKYCADIYKTQTGKVAPNVEAVIPDPQDKSKRLDTYGSISDVCQVLTLFQEIGDKAGPYLNDDTWLNVVNTYGPIRDPGSGQYASLHTGKYDTNDTFRLVAFDSSIGQAGDWKALTPLQNISG